MAFALEEKAGKILGGGKIIFKGCGVIGKLKAKGQR